MSGLTSERLAEIENESCHGHRETDAGLAWCSCFEVDIEDLVAEVRRLRVRAESAEQRLAEVARIVELSEGEDLISVVRDMATEHDVWAKHIGATQRAEDDLTARLHAAEQRLAEVTAAGNAMAEAMADLLAGGIEMKPAEDGPVTFEAMLMMLQMLGVHRGQWRALVAGTEGTGGER